MPPKAPSVKVSSRGRGRGGKTNTNTNSKGKTTTVGNQSSIGTAAFAPSDLSTIKDKDMSMGFLTVLNKLDSVANSLTSFQTDITKKVTKNTKEIA